MNTKLHAVCDSQGRPLNLFVTAGQISDYKANIPLADRSDWEDWINRDRAEIARLTAEIAQAEAQIDSIVYDLFDLTEDEIALLESAV